MDKEGKEGNPTIENEDTVSNATTAKRAMSPQGNPATGETDLQEPAAKRIKQSDKDEPSEPSQSSFAEIKQESATLCGRGFSCCGIRFHSS